MNRMMVLTVLIALVLGILPACAVAQNGVVPNLPDISGSKFYDCNYNGCRDLGEKGICGIRIELFAGPICPETYLGTTVTDYYGNYCFENLPPGRYLVRECLPKGCWLQTCPKNFTDTFIGATGGIYDICLTSFDVCRVDFGNLCLGAGGARSLGYWSNKNGQAVIKQKVLAINSSGILSCSILEGLPNTCETAPYIRTLEQLNKFLLGANARDMRYMLAAQWMAMGLNILTCQVKEDAKVCVGGLEFITVRDLLTIVRVNFCLWDRGEQDWAKRILDDANNNKIFLQSKPCAVVYPVLQ